MWQRFTESAKRTVFYAQQEAKHMGTKDVASEHLLLGLLRQVQEQQGKVWPPAPTGRVETANVASYVLGELRLELDTVRAEVQRQRPRPAPMADGDAHLTRDAKQVIDLSYKEAKRFPVPMPYIGTEHLLLGLILDEEGLAGRILAHQGADIEQVRSYIEGPRSQESDPISETPGFWRRFCEWFAPRG